MARDDIEQAIEAASRLQMQRTRELLFSEGRPDLVADLDRKLKEIRLGIDSAKRCWHALSAAQRRALEAMEPGRKLHREPASRTWYVGIGSPHACGRVCQLPTVRNLIARDLVDLEGGAFDPESVVTLSERGRFVLAQGRQVLKSRRRNKVMILYDPIYKVWHRPYFDGCYGKGP